MCIAKKSGSSMDEVRINSGAFEKRAHANNSGENELQKEKKLEKMAKKNSIREKIIIDVIDDDISKVDGLSEDEIQEYNREYEEFMLRGKASMPIYPIEKIMVTNIQDYMKFSKDNNPAMVYFSQDLKIPLLTLKSGSEVKPHTDTTGIYYVLHGKGSIKIGMKNYSVTSGSLIHVPKGVVRSIQCEETLTIMAIHIS